MYTFKNTERNNEKASNFETKSLLYLIGKRDDSEEIEYVIFDCFNDVSGLNKCSNKIWDIQSKNEKSLNPKKIGTYFFTLFDNYTSELSFKRFIFFAPILSSKYKINCDISCFGMENINSKTKVRIENGLCEEVKRVKGSSEEYIEKIKNFLDIVLIVEDNESENDYIKQVVKFKGKNIKTEEFYKSVFRDLRDLQSAKKNINVENKSIKEIRDVLSFNKHLRVKDIEILILSRIIGCEIFNYNSIPLYFSYYIEGCEIEEKKDTLQECNSNLSKAFFNKNSNKVFWEICERILNYYSTKNIENVDIAYKQIFIEYNTRLSYLNEITIKYLISIIIEGIK